MLNLDNIVSNKKKSSSKTDDWPFRMLVIGPSGSGKTNTLLHLIDKFHPIDKIYLYAKDTDKEKLIIIKEYYNKYKNTLVDYTKTLEQLNNAENTYGREKSKSNNIINELRDKIQNLENAENESLKIIDELKDKLENKNISEND